MWSPIKHSLLVRRLGKNPHNQSSAFLSPKDEEQASRSVGTNIQKFHLWQSRSDWKVVLGGWWWQSDPWQSLPAVTRCLFPQLPTAFSLWASGTRLYFVQILGIHKERLQHEGFRLKPEKQCLLQGASGLGVHGSIPTRAPRLPGLYHIKLRLAAPCRMGA